MNSRNVNTSTFLALQETHLRAWCIEPFCVTRVLNVRILQRIYELISAFATQFFCSF